MAEQDIVRLLSEYAGGRNPKVKDQIVVHYKNLVESMARRYAGSTEPLEDLIQEGYIGLLNAIDLFDPGKGVRFSTYATHFIIGQIKHYLRDKGKIIKEPAWLQELNQKLMRAAEHLYQNLGRQPTLAEIAEEMNLTEEAVSELLATQEVFKVSSLDGNGSEDDEDFPMLVDTDKIKSQHHITFQLPIEDKIVLQGAMGKLKDLEQKVISEFFFKELNQTEIAKKLGISCNYVSHLLRTGTKKLKQILLTEELKETQKQIHLLQKRVETYQQVAQEMTISDPLTGLYNRRYFDDRIEEEVMRASRYQHELSVAFFQLEELADYEAQNGSRKADEILKLVGEAIKDQVRRVDIPCVFDRATFAVILPHTGSQSRIVRDRIYRYLVQKMPALAPDYPDGFSLKASFAVYPGDGERPQAIIETAMEKLACPGGPGTLWAAA
ncbi:MAG: sigma-70 family RNA polymerase sigma factor [Armatimonadetes bacterium]|nr:sigma-70 family RNA polymerase sigma factor [Armatimonadota bacterium]